MWWALRLSEMVFEVSNRQQQQQVSAQQQFQQNAAQEEKAPADRRGL